MQSNFFLNKFLRRFCFCSSVKITWVKDHWSLEMSSKTLAKNFRVEYYQYSKELCIFEVLQFYISVPVHKVFWFKWIRIDCDGPVWLLREERRKLPFYTCYFGTGFKYVSSTKCNNPPFKSCIGTWMKRYAHRSGLHYNLLTRE